MKMYKIGVYLLKFFSCVATEKWPEKLLLNYWLARFVVKVRRIDQRPYPLPICIEEFESDC